MRCLRGRRGDDRSHGRRAADADCAIHETAARGRPSVPYVGNWCAEPPIPPRSGCARALGHLDVSHRYFPRIASTDHKPVTALVGGDTQANCYAPRYYEVVLDGEFRESSGLAGQFGRYIGQLLLAYPLIA